MRTLRPHPPRLTERFEIEVEPNDEIEVTAEMIEAGSDRLDELTLPGRTGLLGTPAYVAKAIYVAMERRRLETTADQKQDAD